MDRIRRRNGYNEKLNKATGKWERASSPSRPPNKPPAKPSNSAITLPNSRRAGANLPKIGAQVERSTTQGPTLRGSKPPAKPTGKFKAPDIPKPPAKPPAKPSLRGALRGAVGRGNALILGLSAANAAQESLMTPEQRKRKAEAAIRPITMADMPGSRSRAANSIPRTPDSKRDPEFRRGAGAGAGDMNTNKPRPTRVADYRDAQGNLYDGNTGRLKQAAPRRSTAPTRSNGGNPPAPGSSRRQPSSGGGSSAPSRPSRPSSPQTSSGTAGKGQQWSDFNPNRGTSKSNNPLLDREGGYLRERMKAREDAANKKFDTNSDIYTPNTKVDGSGLDTKKLKKRRFGTDS